MWGAAPTSSLLIYRVRVPCCHSVGAFSARQPVCTRSRRVSPLDPCRLVPAAHLARGSFRAAGPVCCGWRSSCDVPSRRRLVSRAAAEAALAIRPRRTRAAGDVPERHRLSSPATVGPRPTGNAGSKKLDFEELGIRKIPLGWNLRVRLRPAPHWPDDQKSSMNETLERAWEAP